MKINKYNINDILSELDKDSYGYPTKENFYSPSDDRHIESYIEDVEDGDNFIDYCEYIFKLLEEEDYYD